MDAFAYVKAIIARKFNFDLYCIDFGVWRAWSSCNFLVNHITNYLLCMEASTYVTELFNWVLGRRWQPDDTL